MDWGSALGLIHGLVELCAKGSMLAASCNIQSAVLSLSAADFAFALPHHTEDLVPVKLMRGTIAQHKDA